MSVASARLFSILVFWAASTSQFLSVGLPSEFFFTIVCLPPIAAAIIEYSSYRIALHGMGGAFALALILVFFWMPESAYMREALNIDTGETNVSILLFPSTSFH